MSTRQFRIKTSELALPEEIYEKFQKVVKECKICSQAAPAPSHSRISGIRSQNFGDLIFVDHAEVIYGTQKFLVLLVVDGATNLLSVYPQENKREETTIEGLREWMDNFQCKPKYLVSDMAFMTPEFRSFYSLHKITAIPTGPRTPWPNRAETGVRLFKAQFRIMCQALREEMEGSKITFKQAVKACVWARNNQHTKDGRTPLELATGRRPPDLFDVEGMNPEQLSQDMPESEKTNISLRKIALKSHIEARQLEDLRHDLALRVRPSEGPFKPGERVFVWVNDHGKIKDKASWVSAKVLSQQGPMVTAETHKSVIKINESKVRRNHDKWHDIPLPEYLERPQPETSTGIPEGPEPSSSSSGTISKTGASSSSDFVVFWSNQEETDLLEMTPAKPILSAMAAVKFNVAEPVICHPRHQYSSGYLTQQVKRCQPKLLVIVPARWSQLEDIRRATELQAKMKRKFMVILSYNSAFWTSDCIKGLLENHCLATIKGTEGSWSVLHNCEENIWNLTLKGRHVQGSLFTKNNRMNSCFVISVLNSMQDNLKLTENTREFLTSIAQEKEELEGLKAWIGSRNQGHYILASHHTLNPLHSLQPREIKVQNSKMRHMMTFVERLPAGTEILLHEEGNKFPRLSTLALHMRIATQPNNSFQCCSILRGSHGRKAPLHLVGDDAVVVMWKRRHLDKFYVLNPRSVSPQLDFTQWSILLFWNEQGKGIGGPPDIDMNDNQDQPPDGPNIEESPMHLEPPGITLQPDENMPQPDEDMPLQPDLPPDYPGGDFPQQAVDSGPNLGPEYFDISQDSDMESTVPEQIYDHPDSELKEEKRQISPESSPVLNPELSVPAKRRKQDITLPSAPAEKNTGANPRPQGATSSNDPYGSGEAQRPLLPVQEDDDEASDIERSSTNPSEIPTEYYEPFESDLIIDQSDWSTLTPEIKVHANCSSFTIPQINGIDISKEDSNIALSHSFAVSNAKKNRSRKEATATDMRMYAKQFAEAKAAECKSWKDNQVYTLVDTRKIKCKNWVTGRWVLTVKKNSDGSFSKTKARWVLRGFQDSQKFEQQTDSPTASRPGFRLTCQLAANKKWQPRHIDLKTAFLQGEEYDNTRDVICQLPPEAGYPPYIGARLVKPAYGMNDAPRRWWNKLDGKLRSYGMVPARADRCVYVHYKPSPRVKNEEKQFKESIKKTYKTPDNSVDDMLDFLLDPITGSPARGMTIHGVIDLHVDDLFMVGDKVFEKDILTQIKRDFQVGSEDTENVVFTGQRVRWQKGHIVVDQDQAVEELSAISIDSSLKDNVKCNPQQHTAFRSLLGSLNWLQSRTQFHVAYKFSRAASAAAAPTIGDIRMLNKVVRTVRSNPVRLHFWPLEGTLRIIGYPDASYRNNEDQSSQRGQVVFVGEERKRNSPHSRGSLVDYESTKIRRTTLSTTVSELYSFMKCYGTCQFLRGLWMDISGQVCEVHMRTDANNLVTTASTTHLPDQKETIHMIQMLRKEACSGGIDDLSHVRSEDCLSDCLTKHSAKPDNLIKASETGVLPNVDSHPLFRTMLQHRAYLSQWAHRNLDIPAEQSFLLMQEIRSPCEPQARDYWKTSGDKLIRVHNQPRSCLFVPKPHDCPVSLSCIGFTRITDIITSSGETSRLSDTWIEPSAERPVHCNWIGETVFLFRDKRLQADISAQEKAGSKN